MASNLPTVWKRKARVDMSLRNKLERIVPDQAFVLTAILLIGAALRIYGLISGLWYDEIVTLVESVRPSLREIVTHFPSNNDHLLYSVLGHLSIGIFGEHAWSLRPPAFVFGVLSLLLVYWCSRSSWPQWLRCRQRSSWSMATLRASTATPNGTCLGR